MNLKPYDNQLRIPSDDLAEMYLNNEHNTIPFKMLIGNCDIKKENWIARNKKNKDVIIISAYNSSNSLFARWKLNRSLFKQITIAKKNKQHIIWFCGDYTKKDRARVLNRLSTYRKCAVVWEEDMNQMLKDGYERPTLDEGFDDFTYIVS